MSNVLNVLGGPPPQKMLETGEMLNMLNALNVLGETQPKTPKHLTYTIFPLKGNFCYTGVRPDLNQMRKG